jgi:hypothetical protein
VSFVNGRFFFGRAIALVLLLVVLGGLGVLAYNAGVTAGATQAAQVVVQDGQPVTVVPYAPYPYWHGGFGFFGFIFWILGFFLIIGLLRAVFGWGRWGRGGWGGSGGHGYYGGPGGPAGPGGPGGPGGPYGDRMDRVADWHRELHRRDEAGTGSRDSGAPPAGSAAGG